MDPFRVSLHAPVHTIAMCNQLMRYVAAALMLTVASAMPAPRRALPCASGRRAALLATLECWAPSAASSSVPVTYTISYSVSHSSDGSRFQGNRHPLPAATLLTDLQLREALPILFHSGWMPLRRQIIATDPQLRPGRPNAAASTLLIFYCVHIRFG